MSLHWGILPPNISEKWKYDFFHKFIEMGHLDIIMCLYTEMVLKWYNGMCLYTEKIVRTVETKIK